MAEVRLNILCLGASYGLLLGLKAAYAGHAVHFVCRPREAALINAGAVSLELPSKTNGETLCLTAEGAATTPIGIAPEHVEVSRYDLCILAMQEPQCSDPQVHALLKLLGRHSVPIISILNMPLPPYIHRRLAIEPGALESVWHDAHGWEGIRHELFSAASPDPQALCTLTNDHLSVRVTLASNIKVAPFIDARAQEMLEVLARSLSRIRVDVDGSLHEVSVRLVAHSSPWIPLAKWPMLITGNFRCVTSSNPVSIAEAVHIDEEISRGIYEKTQRLCLAVLPPTARDSNFLVPFDKYAQAARALVTPSSLARGLAAGACKVERVDRLLLALAARQQFEFPELRDVAALVDAKLSANVAAAQ